MSKEKLIKRNITSHIPPRTSQKGITLIALVVTIIVMLILAAVTINMVTGDESVIKQAKSSRDKQEREKDLEIIKTAVSAQNMELAMLNKDISELNNEEKEAYTSAIEQEIEKKLGPATVVLSADGRSLTVIIEEDPEHRTHPITLGDGNEVIVSTATATATTTVTQAPATTTPTVTSSNLISFTLWDLALNAEPGMTWSEWITSDYNDIRK